MKENAEQIKSLKSKLQSTKDALKLKEDKLEEKIAEIDQLDKKNKSLKDTIQKLSTTKSTKDEEK